MLIISNRKNLLRYNVGVVPIRGFTSTNVYERSQRFKLDIIQNNIIYLIKAAIIIMYIIHLQVVMFQQVFISYAHVISAAIVIFVLLDFYKTAFYLLVFQSCIYFSSIIVSCMLFHCFAGDYFKLRVFRAWNRKHLDHNGSHSTKGALSQLESALCCFKKSHYDVIIAPF